MPLDHLPPEILRLICDFIDHEHPPSVLAFACVNKNCYSAAVAVVYHTIRFAVHNAQDIASGVEEYLQMLQRAPDVQLVKQIIVINRLDWSKAIESNLAHNWQLVSTCRYSIHPEDDPLGQVMERPVLRGSSHSYTNLAADIVYEFDNESWRPLSNLIQQLPSLTDLIFDCPRQLPPCILDALHHRQLQCRLHLYDLQLPSLTASTIDEHEFRLAKSPCLHGVRILYHEMGGFGDDDMPIYIGDAVMDLVKGMAPNLRELAIAHRGLGARLWRTHVQRELWRGLPRGEKLDGCSLGALETLELDVYDNVTADFMRTWQAHTDFSTLQTLKIRLQDPIGEDALEYMGQTPSCFPSLLSLYLNWMKLGPRFGWSRTLPPLLERFICSLPPLSTLALHTGEEDLTLNLILERHSHTLRNLMFTSYAYGNPTEKVIMQLSRQCHLLQILSITVSRSRGDATEVRLYRTLGSLPRLWSLDLTLDASARAVMGEDGPDPDVDEQNVPETPSDPSFDNFDQQFCAVEFGGRRRPRNGHIRDAMINSALDESLARAIFHAVSSGKPNGSQPLERLIVVTVGGGDFGDTLDSDRLSELSDVFHAIGGSWRVERSPRDDCRDQLLVNSLKQERGFKRFEIIGSQLPRWLETIYHRIWPAKKMKSESNWRTDWHSFPLSVEFDSAMGHPNE